jgi:MYXO-CTERM domain-containing protein
MLPLLLPALVLAAVATPLPEADRFLDSRASRTVEAENAGSRAWLQGGAVTGTEPRLGVPTFVFVPDASPRPELSPDAIALTALAAHRDLWRLDASDLRTLELKSLQDLGVGPRIARFVQRIDGIEVFRAGLNAALNRQGALVALSGYAAPHALTAAGQARVARLTAADAVAIALSDLANHRFTARHFGEATHTAGGYLRFGADGQGAGSFITPPRAKRVYFQLAEGLEPAYYVEGDFQRAGEDAARTMAYVISAADGSLLYRHNQVADVATSYRVWAETSGLHQPWDGPQGVTISPKANPFPDNSTAPFVSPNLVTLDHGPISTNDPWLNAGTTIASGNNAHAFADVASPDGFGPGDVEADMDGAQSFGRTYDVTAPPNTASQQKAAVVQLFYDVNYFHDWYYDVGFKEVDGNAQLSNYGRGGVEGDPLVAEGEDFAGRDNANMSTPSDGASPRMRMYIWDGPTDPSQNLLQITAPAAAAGSYLATFGGFGPQSFDLTGTVALARNGGQTDGCSAITNNVSGSIAYVDRGTCAFTIKVKNAQNAGAIGVIIGSNSTSPIGSMGGTDATITVPSMLVEQATGVTIKSNAAAGMTARMLHTAGIDRDGTIDNSVIGHEWGHYISNRLIADANGLSTNLNRGLGEGWADSHAMLLVVRAGDDLVASNSTWNGVYPLAVYDVAGIAANATYYGIRRYPYSTDMSKNPLTYKYIQDNVALPTTGVPPSSGQSGASNSEVHNTGEIWASMLWECYAAMLRDTQGTNPRFGSFTAAQDRWRMTMVAAYKLTPTTPTLLEARDAVIAALSASGFPDSSIDVAECWAGFAKRGAGTGATTVDRNDQNTPPIVESFATDGALSYQSASVTEDPSTTCDRDGIVGVGETGVLHVRFRNTGAKTLTQSQLQVTSPTTGINLASATVALPTTQPGQTAEATVPFTVSGLTQPTQAQFNLTVSDPTVTASSSGAFYAWVEAQNGLAVSTIDDAEEPVANWTAQKLTPDGGASDFAWRIQANAGPGHVFFGPDSPHTNDQAWVSPPLQVAATGPLSFTFSHRFALEAGPPPPPATGTAYYDGAVLELSADNGVTWTDIGAAASPGYTQTIFTDTTGAPGGNPLAGRRAFAGRNAQWPALETVTVNLGPSYRGQTIQVRFRVGSDQGGIDYGWEVDDVSFTGLANTPFNHLVTDPHSCVIGASTSSSGSTSTAGSTGSTTSTAGSTGSTTSTAGSSGSTTSTVGSTGSTTSTVGSTGSTSSTGSTTSTAGSTGSTTSTAGSTGSTASTAGSTGSTASTAGSTGSTAGTSGRSSSGSTGHATSGSTGGSKGSSGSTGTTSGATKGGGCGCGTGTTGGLESGVLSLAALAFLARRRKQA